MYYTSTILYRFFCSIEVMVKKLGFFTRNLSVVMVILLTACGARPPSVPLPLTPTAALEPTVPFFSATPYFTDPSVKGKNSPGQTIIAALVKDIYAAHDSIDVAMYNFTHKEIIEALIKASQSGIAVRILVDSDALDKLDLSRLKRVGIYTMGDRRESLMHNKFVIIDEKILWTGSLNLSASGVENDENVQIRLESKELSANYLIKFNEMFNEDKFGIDSRPKTSRTAFNISGVELENYFSPEDTIDTRLVSLVNNAEKSVHVLAYSFTLDRLADALIEADKNGVEVRGVFDRESAEENQGADYFQLRDAGLDVHLDRDDGLMHIKAIIVDGETVAFGSYNFTASAENRNDENVLIISDPALAARFEDAFERIYAKAK